MSPETAPAPPGPRFRWPRAAAGVLVVLCLFWVLSPIVRHAGELIESVDGPALAAGIVTGAVSYALLCALLAAGWWWLAGAYGRRPGLRPAASVWARSQLAKYLPGNVFHLVSRQVLGRGLGLSHAALVASALLEMTGQLLAAAGVAAAGATLIHAPLPPQLSVPVAVVVALCALLTWPAVDRLLRRWPWTAARMADLPVLSPGRAVRLLAPAVVLYALFFGGSGLVLWAILADAWPTAEVPAVAVVWLYAVAWTAGTVTPGAPGGVGVREAVLTFELTPLIGGPRAATLAVALRLVTLGGDLLTGLAGWALRGAEAAGGSNEGRVS